MNEPTGNPSTNRETDQADTLMDLNLRSLAEVMRIPGEGDPPRVHEAHDERPARRRGRPRWLALASAAGAACLAAAGIVYTHQSTPKVQAAEILASLRQAQILGLDIQLDRLTSEGATVDGLIRLRLRTPLPLADVDDPGAWDRADFGGMHARLRLVSAPDAQHLPQALDATLEFGLTTDVGWLYIKADEASADRLAAEFPQARGFILPARNGLLMNLGPIDEELLRGFHVDMEHDAEFAPPPGAPSITVRGAARPAAPGGDGPAGEISVETSVRVSTPADEALDRLSGNLLRGTAGRAEIDQIRSLLNGQDQQTTVNDLGNGRYELVAMLKDSGEAAASARMTILYEQNAGVRSVTVDPLDGASGSIRLTMAETPIDPADLDMARVQAIPGTTYFDMRMFRSLIQGFANPAMFGDAPGTSEPADEPMDAGDPDAPAAPADE